MLAFLKRIFSRKNRSHDPVEVQELRAAFAHRYHNFKLLLTANNKALEIMSDLEKALDGTHVFGMAFVRSNCTAVLVNVFRIIKHLEELAPGKYTALFDRFKMIQEQIHEVISQKKAFTGDRLVIPLPEITREMTDQVGSKMANVAEIRNRIGLPVPAGFVISAFAYQRFIDDNDLQSEINRRIQATNTEDMNALYELSAGIQQLIINAHVPEELAAETFAAYVAVEAETYPGIRVSLRSSALGEDAAGASFAGQFRSVLNVGKESLLQAYKEVVASKYGLPGVTYRLNRGIPDEDVAMCVGAMAMVNATVGGVIYTSNPLNIRDKTISINSVWGLPKAVVDGTVDPDVFRIARDTPLRVIGSDIKNKEVEFTCFEDEGVCRSNVATEKRTEPSLTQEQALELAGMAVQLEEFYGSPQDIEWAVDQEGSILILQCRPLQQLPVSAVTQPAALNQCDYGEALVCGGITASPGVVCGQVFQVKNDVDKLRFPQGAILFTTQSLPSWAPLLGRAAGVVTELGGVAGHLANVAREFGVPALFGVPGAMAKVPTGQVVTLDADGLTIYGGRIENLLQEEHKKKNLMEGSPVYETLENAAKHIIPLTLLDPEAIDFRPSACETLHDITRFSHEKSVHEMFSFGKDHHFSERSSKQLVCQTPMQWWIINLDDAYKTDVDGKFVNLDNIRSIPMLALWDGVISVPWAGPPPLDAGGFMSVLMQATANPALDPSMKSAYAVRNYFMISRNFMSLASRFGFHFSTVEALVGSRPSENYISFSFKGGAADYPRRVRRAVFVGDILEKYNFRTEVKKDSAFARIEGRDEEFMKERLRILGYLIIHTRQLDMVMSNEAVVQKHKRQILQDINTKVLRQATPPSENNTAEEISAN